MRYGRGNNTPKLNKLFFVVFVISACLTLFSLVVMLSVHWFGDFLMGVVEDLNFIQIVFTSFKVGLMVWAVFLAVYTLLGLIVAVVYWIYEIILFVTAVFRHLFSRHK